MIAKTSMSLLGALLLAAVPAHAETSEISGRAAIDRLLGNTLVSTPIDPMMEVQDGLLLLRADGTAAWVNIGVGDTAKEVRWTVDERDWLCIAGFDDVLVDDACTGIVIAGDEVTMLQDDSSSEGRLTIRLEKGNSRGL